MPNLKEQILSVRLRKPENQPAVISKSPKDSVKSEDDHEESSTVDGYCPLQASTTEEIELLKKMACVLADLCAMLGPHATLQDTPNHQALAAALRLPDALSESNLSALINLAEECTCDGEKKLDIRKWRTE